MADSQAKHAKQDVESGANVRGQQVIEEGPWVARPEPVIGLGSGSEGLSPVPISMQVLERHHSSMGHPRRTRAQLTGVCDPSVEPVALWGIVALEAGVTLGAGIASSGLELNHAAIPATTATTTSSRFQKTGRSVASRMTTAMIVAAIETTNVCGQAIALPHATSPV